MTCVFDHQWRLSAFVDRRLDCVLHWPMQQERQHWYSSANSRGKNSSMKPDHCSSSVAVECSLALIDQSEATAHNCRCSVDRHVELVDRRSEDDCCSVLAWWFDEESTSFVLSVPPCWRRDSTTTRRTEKVTNRESAVMSMEYVWKSFVLKGFYLRRASVFQPIIPRRVYCWCEWSSSAVHHPYLWFWCQERWSRLRSMSVMFHWRSHEVSSNQHRTVVYLLRVVIENNGHWRRAWRKHAEQKRRLVVCREKQFDHLQCPCREIVPVVCHSGNACFQHRLHRSLKKTIREDQKKMISPTSSIESYNLRAKHFDLLHENFSTSGNFISRTADHVFLPLHDKVIYLVISDPAFVGRWTIFVKPMPYCGIR